MMGRSFERALFTLALLLAARTSQATPDFPSAIQSDLSLPNAVQCTLCHAGDRDPGSGTATTPFALSMRAAGLVPGDETSLADALQALEKAGTDSDHDGIPDIEELREGSDPNSAGAVEPISYGCSVRGFSASGAARELGGWAALAIFGLAWVWRRARAPLA